MTSAPREILFPGGVSAGGGQHQALLGRRPTPSCIKVPGPPGPCTHADHGAPPEERRTEHPLEDREQSECLGPPPGPWVQPERQGDSHVTPETESAGKPPCVWAAMG